MDEQKQSDPAPQPIVVNTSSGDTSVRSMGMKVLMYFVMPLIILAGIGYFGYITFQKRQTNVITDQNSNTSTKYQDNKVKIQIKVDNLKPNVNDNQDVQTFQRVQGKIKQFYGL